MNTIYSILPKIFMIFIIIEILNILLFRWIIRSAVRQAIIDALTLIDIHSTTNIRKIDSIFSRLNKIIKNQEKIIQELSNNEIYSNEESYTQTTEEN